MGSEMCIRDSACQAEGFDNAAAAMDAAFGANYNPWGTLAFNWQ